MDKKNGTIKHGGSGRSRGNFDSNIIFPPARPRLKLFVWISSIPTYNSGIEQYLNYTKHFGKNRGGRGVAYKCGKIASVSSDLCVFIYYYLGMCVLIFGLFFCYSHMIRVYSEKQGIGNVDYSKILLAWIVTSFFFFFFGLENDFVYILYTEQWINGTL